MDDSSDFEKLQILAEEQGLLDAVQFLVSRFRERELDHQLFEALKMKIRLELGLPLLYGQTPDDIDEEKQAALEKGLLNACREVGVALFNKGELREAWMYLQPLGERQLLARLFAELDVDKGNLDDVIEIGLTQGAAPELGYQLLLDEYGTCNAITTFDTQIVQLEKPVQRKLATQLVEHIYEELVANITNHVNEREGDHGPGLSKRQHSLCELTSDRRWLTENGAHHIDTTHLASLMRIGRIVDQIPAIIKLKELADYGSSLDNEFQYPGSPPFENTFQDHLMFYRALAGESLDSAILHFRKKVENTDELEFGTVAVETLVDLLHRTGQSEQALTLATQSLLGKENQMGIAPNIFELAKTKEDYSTLMSHYLEQDDLLSFSVGLFQSKQRLALDALKKAP